MLTSSKTASYWWFFAFALIFSLQVVPRIFIESPINDEPGELTNGYFYWKGDVITHNHHPPIPKMLQALPLRALHLNESSPPGIQNSQLRAHDFFFALNKDRFEWMTALGRFITLLFGLGLGLLLFFHTRQSHPAVLGSALVLWAFEPTIQAYSSLCLADLPVAFFFLAAVIAFQKHLEKPGTTRSLLAGGLAGMAVCSKFSALALLPIFGLLEGFHYFQLGGKERRHLRLFRMLRDWSWGAVGFLFLIFLVYLPGTLLDSNHRFPFIYFYWGLMDMIHYSGTHHPTYFLGQASRENHWLFFPVAFALKSTVPFLLLTLLTLGKSLFKKPGFPPWLWIPPIFFFLCILPVQNLGVRYLLPAYPFFILMAAQTAGEWWQKKEPLLNGLWEGFFFGMPLAFWQVPRA